MKKALSALIGAGVLLLIVAQFLPLYHTHISSTAASLGSQTVGSSHAYGVLFLAVIAALLGWGALLTGNRFALLLVGIVGIAALVIALGHDLSHARGHGVKVLGVNDYAQARNVVGIGLYAEVAGALALLMAAGLGLLLAGPQMAAIAKAAPTARAVRVPKPARRRSPSETIGRRYDEE